MADNSLTIAIGADSSKLRADLALATASVRDLSKQMNAAAKAALKSGDREGVEALASQLGAAEAKAGGLRREMANVGKGAEEHHRGLLGLAQGLRAHFAHAKEAMEPAREALKGIREDFARVGESLHRIGDRIFGEHFKQVVELGAAASVAGLYEFVHSSAEAAEEVGLDSERLGVGVRSYQALQIAAEKAGVSADNFRHSFMRLSQHVVNGAQQQRNAIAKVGKDLYGGVSAYGAAVLRGGDQSAQGGGAVLRGGTGAAPGQIAPGFIAAFNGDFARVHDFAEALHTMLGPKVQMTTAQLQRQIVDVADSIGKAGDRIRAQLLSVGIALHPRTIADRLNNLALGWEQKLGALGIPLIDPKTLHTIAPDKAAVLAAHYFQGLPRGAHKTALAGQIFGVRAGTQMISFLDRWHGSVRHLVEEYDKLGIVINQDQTTAGMKAVEVFRTFGIVLDGLKNQLGLIFAPVFTPLIDALTDAVTHNARALRAWAQDIATRAKPVVTDFIGALEGKKIQTPWLASLAADVRGLIAGIKGAVPVLKSAFSGIRDVLGDAASAINRVFGTHLTAASLGIVLAVTKLTGAFGALASVAGLGASSLRFLRELVLLARGFGVIRLLGQSIVFLARASLAFLATPLGAALTVVAVAAVLIYENWSKIRPIVATALGALEAFGAFLLGAFLGAWHAAIKQFVDAWDWAVGWIEGGIDRLFKLFDAIGEKIAAVAHAIGGLFGGKGGGAALAAGMAAGAGHAAGGLIRGPGSGTSDSIPARLSNGEYVVNAAAVAQPGGRAFLDAINSGRVAFSALSANFAAGGLVDTLAHMRAPHFAGAVAPMLRTAIAPLRFASGGPVAAAGHGTTLNLTIGGETFRGLSAPDAVAGHLLRYARARQMSAGGTKPSWYGC